MKDLKEAAKHIFLSTLNSLDLDTVMRERINVVDETLFVGAEPIALSDFKEVVLIGFGKASIRMGAVIEAMLKGRVKRGLLVTNRRSNTKLNSQVIVAGHPLPDANSFRAGKEICDLIRSCGSDSLILFLISGGGSSLVEVPVLAEVTPEEIKDLNQILINCGATIREINVIRKHLSLIKGGRLGQLASGCQCIALYVSDVNEGDLKSIASNPLLPEEIPLKGFYEIIEKYGLLAKLPDSIYKAVIDKRIPVVSKARDQVDQGFLPLLLLENRDALSAAARVAKENGYEIEIESGHSEGGYREIADRLINRLFELRKASLNKGVCLISGGEVSCPVQGDGLGGRNQEFVLYSASQLADSGFKEAAVLSCGTDGVDGNSFATGAVADSEMIGKAEELGLIVSEFLRRNDSHSFFQKMGGMVVSGPTENNVRDIRVLLAQ
jgi:glycerate-2-kinase